MRRTPAVVLALGVLAATLISGSCGQTVTPVAPSATPTARPTQTPTPTPLSATITTQDAFSLIQSNKGNPGFVIIDVRTPAEFSAGHIADAVNMDYYSPDFRSNVGMVDRNSRYLVYCRTGIRGAAATQIMQDMGFKQVQNLTGGLDQWILDGYPTVM